MKNNKQIILERLLPKLENLLTKKGILKENIQPEIEDVDNTPVTPNLTTDEVGEFFVILAPQEDSTTETMVNRTNLMDLMHKVKLGELSLENIRSIKKKEGSALRMASKMIREFNTELTETRKTKLSQLIKKREGLQKYLEGYKMMYGDLDESSNMKISQYENALNEVDNKISEIQAKLKKK